MALSKEIATEFGVPAKYWHIGAIQEDFKGKGTEVTLYGYADQAAREAGKQPLAVAKTAFVGEQYVADMVRADVYMKIKAENPAFKDAEDA